MTYLLGILIINVISTYTWQSIPSPGIRAFCHSVVYDPNNDIFFVIGGDSTNSTDYMDICLMFDPETNTWNTLEPMSIERAQHASSYRNGFIHTLCGKDNDGNFLNTHEVYDINGNSWSTAASTPAAVGCPNAVTWRDSLVYLIGGSWNDEVYVYDAATNSWNTATSLPADLYNGSAKIKGDSIFIIGGSIGWYCEDILLGEINPSNPTEINWSWGESFPMAFNGANGLAIKNNKAYMIGGDFDDGTNEVWEYDIINETWIPLPDYPTTAIHRGDAERRDGNNSLGIIYSFMGDTTSTGVRTPTDECFRLIETACKKDVGMYRINSPASDTSIGASVSVNGTVKNYGTETCVFKSGVNIYDPDLNIVFTESGSCNSLAPTDTLNINFGSFQLEKAGTYTVEMFTYAADDANSSNDTLKATFECYGNCYWQKLPSPGIRNHDHAVVYDPNKDLFFIIGGDSSGNQTNMDVCLAFDPETNTWDTKTPMPTKRARHRAAFISGLSTKKRCEEVNGFIHVLCGKYDGGTFVNTHEVYDIKNDSWSTKAPAPVAVSRPSVVPWRDSLVYLMGGYSPATTGVYYYDTENDSWHTATSLPRRLHGGGAEIKGDTIFIIGGADGSSAYSNILIGEINPNDPSDINWSWGEPLPLSSNQYNNGLAIKDNKAYMIGGLYNDGTNQVWEYDIPDETWTQLPDYPTSVIIRGDFAETRGSVNSDGIVYCFMGDTTGFYSRKPTDECYLLMKQNSIAPEQNGITEKIAEENSIEIINHVSTNNEISIRYTTSENSDLKICMYDVTGREILSQTVKNVSSGLYTVTIDKNIKNGIYLIRTQAGANTVFGKIILIR